jgi:hypothetical protein
MSESKLGIDWKSGLSAKASCDFMNEKMDGSSPGLLGRLANSRSIFANSALMFRMLMKSGVLSPGCIAIGIVLVRGGVWAMASACCRRSWKMPDARFSVLVRTGLSVSSMDSS